MILLDTDVLIEIFDKKSKVGNSAYDKILNSKDRIAITSINLHEILYGLEKYAKTIGEVLQLPVLNFTKSDAMLSAKIEYETEKDGSVIRRTDAMIAAISINNNACLYTLDLKHFKPLESQGLELFPKV
jgi:predicted nucleic acid-binding protein